MLRKKLLNERAAGVTRGEEIRATAEAEGRDFTAEELAEFAKLKERRAAIDAQLAVLEEQREAERTMVAVGETTSPANAVANITHVHDRETDKPWGSLGEQLQAVVAASHPTNREVDKRLYRGAASGASSGVPDDGGFLVQTDYSTALLEAGLQESVLAPMCRELPVGANADGIELPFVKESSRANGSRFGGVQVYWKGEADTVTASKPEFGEFEIRLQELMGIAYATGRLLKDSVALEGIFTTAFTSEFGFKIDDAIVRGTGAGQPLGFINATDVRVQQAKETGQAADTIVAENLSKMWTHMPSRNKQRAVWLYNSEVTPQLDALVIPAGTGGLDPRIVTYNPDGTGYRIKGRPAMEIEHAAALGDEGDIMLVDMNEYLLIRKGALESDQSMHVRFLYDEMTFRWTYRINGRPAWHSSVTAYKGTSLTVSPFVTLAARA